MSQDRHLPVVVGITAASGAALTERCITWLAAHGVPLYVTCSSNGRLVWQQELDESLEEAAVRWSDHGDVTLVDVGDEAALIASGSLAHCGDDYRSLQHGIGGGHRQRYLHERAPPRGGSDHKRG